MYFIGMAGAVGKGQKAFGHKVLTLGLTKLVQTSS